MTKANKTASSIKIVDNKLILSLPDAKEPVVWQMDLAHAQAAAFTVKEDKKANAFNLVFKSQGEKQETVAPFEDKQSAVDVLMETSQTLLNAQSKPQSFAAKVDSSSSSDKDDKIGAALAIILVILLFITWSFFSSAPQKFANMDGVGSGSYNAATGNPRETSGVAVSADDFLSNR